MIILSRRRRFAAAATLLAVLVGVLGLGATSATAEPATDTITSMGDGFPLSPTAIVAFGNSHYVVGNNGALYEWNGTTATAVSDAPGSITKLVVIGEALFALSAPASTEAKIVRFDGTTFTDFSRNTPLGQSVAFGNELVSTVMIGDVPSLERRGAAGDSFSQFSTAPSDITALTVFNNELYAANATGVWILNNFDFELISGTPTDIVGIAAIGSTLYLRSATQVYSLVDSVVTSIATISTTAMTVANDRLYVKSADNTRQALVLGDSGFSAIPFVVTGDALVALDALLIFTYDSMAYSYDGPGPDPIVSTSASPVSAAVTAGPLMASLSEVAFAEVPFSHDAQDVFASATLSADDQTGLLYGWNVTLQASALVWTSPSDATDAARDIPAANLSLAAVTGVTTVTGDTFADGFGGGAALDSAVSVVSTEQGQGSGSYTVPLSFTLAIPANAAAGTYVGTLTTTISAAP